MSERIWIKETFTNATRNVMFGESEIYETRYSREELGQLYRSLVSEYGRCTSKVYVTTRAEDGIPVGWVFQKRMEYEDARRDQPAVDRFYIREVWVHLYDGPATVTCKVTSLRTDRNLELVRAS